jgi:hypothetical protein
MSHTYAVLEIDPRAYAEIKAKLTAAGYEHAVHTDKGGKYREVVDMHGIAVAPSPELENQPATLFATSIYGAKTWQGLVELSFGLAFCTYSPDEARAFALSVIQVAEAAETDEFIMQWLANRVGLKGDVEAVRVLRDFREHRERHKKQTPG